MDTPDSSITSMMHEERLFVPPEALKKGAHITSHEEYLKLHEESLKNPEGFWGAQAEKFLTWRKKWTKVLEWKSPFAKWFIGGTLNVSENCLDRHLTPRGETPNPKHQIPNRAEKTAIIWEGEDGSVRKFTYKELHREVCKCANVLKKLGLKKGDRACIYLPMIPELAITMLACTRIGVVHTIVFGGFSAHSLETRINDSQAKVLITSDGSFHGGKVVPLKANADEALKGCTTITNVLVVTRTKQEIPWTEGRDLRFETAMQGASAECPPEEMDSEDPLFILYTSGTTGKPKGILHTTAGYLLYAAVTHQYVFDLQEDDVYWCTADIGWITGHSYIVYGPLCNGATTVMFESVPSYPAWDRYWQIIEKHKVTKFYTAPTAIRAIAKEGDTLPKKRNMKSLKILGSVGEPINPEAWMWYHTTIGGGRCPIMDTWWQTETGGFLITPLPAATTLKPGSATFPFFGIDAAIFREDGSEAAPNEGGYIVIRKPWPGMLRNVWGDPKRYEETYFGKFKDVYLSGDGGRKDADGYFWVMGRLDDVLKVSGHRIGTAEVESALVSYPGVAEAAVIGVEHKIKGQAIYAFVILKNGLEKNDELAKTLRNHVGKELGPIAKPDYVQFTDGLPKTRSGKIMRRVLKAIVAKADPGDTTTLADPNVVEILKKGCLL